LQAGASGFLLKRALRKEMVELGAIDRTYAVTIALSRG
jgi:hypothetical protein